ncbi:MAG: UDP-N-acetylmuramoyl-L-alanine--D-glutamate ligase [Bacteroidota bacterium]
MKHEDVRGTTFSVVGAAESGVSVARLLASRGAKVFVSDIGTAEKLQKEINTLEQWKIPYELGQNSEKILDAQIVVVSPGVPLTASIVRQAREKGLRVVGEIEVASWMCPEEVGIVAITGSNGKTTTTTLMGRIFADAKKKSVVAGNIGTAFSSVVLDIDVETTAIVEVSSFQLDTIKSFRPEISVLLNITPDHLNRYDYKFENYIASKCRIFENQTIDDYLVYNYDDRVTRDAVEHKARSKVHLLPFSLTEKFDEGAFIDSKQLLVRLAGKEYNVIGIEEISIKGEHNRYNSMASSLASIVKGVGTASLRATLRNFKGVEHRLEFVREVEGVKYVNDSKATNVEAVWYALRSFKEPLVVLIGGRDKGNDYTRLLEPVKNHVRAIVAIGESADNVVTNFVSVVPVERAGTMEEAVEVARRLARPGDVVLLSPACASFDWFNNYEHRGKVFKDIVNGFQ